MAKSILQEDVTSCYICGMNRNLEPLDCHHVYGGSNRNKSEKYGLTIYLHHSKCHIFGRRAIHNDAEMNRAIKAIAQEKAMQHYGWSVEDFIKIFGKNYL